MTSDRDPRLSAIKGKLPDPPYRHALLDRAQRAVVYDETRPLWPALAAVDTGTALGRTQALAALAKHGSDLDWELITGCLRDQAVMADQLDVALRVLDAIVRDLAQLHRPQDQEPATLADAMLVAGRCAGRASAVLAVVLGSAFTESSPLR